MKNYLILPALLFFFTVKLTAQLKYDFAGKEIRLSSFSDNKISAVQNKSYINSLYFKHIASPIDIVNGKEYFLYFYNSRTTPMLYSGKLFKSTLITHGRIYENVMLQYDTFLDEVVYSDTSKIINFQYPKVALVKEFVDGFTLLNETDTMNFRHLVFSSDVTNRPEDGFYEMVYDGTSKYIIRHQSSQYVSIRDATSEYKYSPQNMFIIDNTCHLIKKKKEFLKMFRNQSSIIKEFLHNSRINIKKATRQEITSIIKYYDSLAK